MSDSLNTCGCCEGRDVLTPESTANRPGLDALRYRAGTHATFLETMEARLTSLCLNGDEECEQGKGRRPLRRLTTRARSDATMALLDAWATVADVLTFYQERIANEGYLRTASERRSILELARLVGYTLRPGVAASVFLAYTIDEHTAEPVEIPAGARVQSVPAPGEQMQTFETSEKLEARADWNNLRPRLTRPQNITLNNVLRLGKVHLQGTATNLKIGDRLLFVFGDAQAQQAMRTVAGVSLDTRNGRTTVSLQQVPAWIILGVLLLDTLVTAVKHELPPANGVKEEPSDKERKAYRMSLQEEAIELEGALLLGDDPTLPYRRLMYSASQKTGQVNESNTILKQGTGNVAKVNAKSDPVKINLMPMVTAVVEKAIELLKDEELRHGLARDVVELVDALLATDTANLSAISNALTQELDRLRPTNLQVDKLQDPLLNQVVLELRDFVSTEGLDKILEQFWTAIPRWHGRVQELHNQGIPATSSGQESTPSKSKTLSELISSLIQSKPGQMYSFAHPEGRAAKYMSVDTATQLLLAAQPRLKPKFYGTWASADFSTNPAALQAVFAVRTTAPLFGSNAPLKTKFVQIDNSSPPAYRMEPNGDWSLNQDERANQLFLDNAYETILQGGYVVIESPSQPWHRLAARIISSRVCPRTACGVTGKTTELILSRKWWDPKDINILQNTIVHIAGEKLTLSEVPIDEVVPVDSSIELDTLTDGLQIGRWIIVSGEVTDLPNTSGVHMSELSMVTNVEQLVDSTLPGDRTRTKITLREKLTHSYKRDTVTIYGNVVKATHGETRSEVLGSGDGAREMQQFTLKQSPLTYVSAPTPAGAQSTLEVRADGVRWHETDSLAGQGPKDRIFFTRTDEKDATTILFGNGSEGARLPTGEENIRAAYRFGIGKAGNVKAEQISLLATRPLGVKGVVNPMEATGGADREGRDQARRNAPLAVMALDRLVSVRDYADFARTFAGIGKASAARLSDGRREVVMVTIAGAGGGRVDEMSDLFENLRRALRQYGDPYQPIELRECVPLVMIVSANVRLLPDYLWEFVEPKIRAALLDAFSFERRELGQDVHASEVIAVIQAVPGVAYVDLDYLKAASEDDIKDFLDQIPANATSLLEFLKKRHTIPAIEDANPTEKIILVEADRVEKGRGLQPAQIAYLTPAVPDTLILNTKEG